MPDTFTVRDAMRADLPAIVAMLADDPLGATREQPGEPLLPAYEAGFRAIAEDPRVRLLVAELGGEVVGTLQLTFLAGISRKGSERALIEAVRIAAPHRGKGLGKRLMEAALALAEARGAAMAQLTTDASRKDAHRFYDEFGFHPTHIGYKMSLPRRKAAAA